MSDQSSSPVSSAKTYPAASLGGLISDIRLLILDHLDPSPLLNRNMTGTRAPDFASLSLIDRDWSETVKSYMASTTLKKREPLIFTDLTSQLLGYPGSQAQVIEGDSVKSILERSGAAERLPGSRLGTSEQWVFVIMDFCQKRDAWFEQTLQSLEWLQNLAGTVHCGVQIINVGTELLFEDTSVLLKCKLPERGEPSCNFSEHLVQAVIGLSNAMTDQDTPTVCLNRTALERVTEIPVKAVFREICRPPGAMKVNVQHVSRPLDHVVQTNMSECGSDWSKLEDYVKSTCTYHGKLMDLSTASEGSVTKLHFAVEAGDTATAEKLESYKASLQAVEEAWKAENESKSSITFVFGTEPISEGYICRDDTRYGKFDAGRSLEVGLSRSEWPLLGVGYEHAGVFQQPHHDIDD